MAQLERAVLERIAAADEVEVETRRGDGTARRTVIWTVVEADQPYVRSIKGARGRWYREMRDAVDATLLVGRERVSVRALPVDDADEIARVSEAYRNKYGRSPYLGGAVSAVSLTGTLRLEAR